MVGTRLKHLKFLHNEVLAQARQISCSGGFQKIGKRSLKEFFIRQH